MRFCYLLLKKQALPITVGLFLLLNNSELLKAQIGLKVQGCYINIPSGTNFHVDGNITLESNGKFNNAGEIELKGNWANNSGATGFSSTGGAVKFSGANQAINGSSATTFNNVKFVGTGIKTLSSISDLSFNGDLDAGENGISDVTVVNQHPNLVTIGGNFTVNIGSTFQNNGAGFNVLGNMIMLGGFTGVKNLAFTGTNNQNISGAVLSQIKSLNVNKASGFIKLDIPIAIDSLLVLNSGVVVTDSVNLLTINNAAIITGGNNSSYVSGPIKKIGNSAFSFPIGDNTLSSGAYHPLSITAPANSSDAFVAQYYSHNQSLGNAIQTDSLESISTCEFWSIKSVSGSSVVIPTVGWNSNSCNVSDPNVLALVGWDGAQWRSMGNGGVTLNSLGGLLTGLVRVGPIINIGIGLSKFIVNAGPDKIICAGSSTTLSGTATFRPLTTYSWAPSSGLLNPTSLQPTANPTSTTTYTLTATYLGGISRSDQVTVTVIPSVTISSSLTICSGGSATITANGGTTYSWNTGQTSNSITVSPTSTTSYTVTGINTGCSSTAVATVTVNPLPTIAVNSPTICTGATATLTATGGTTYSWNTGQTTNPVTVSPTSTTSYTVTGTTNGCSRTAVATVTVNPLPAIAVNSPTICTGATATLTATGGTIYSWNTGQTTNPITVSPTTTTSYTVTGTTNGCSGTAVATVTIGPNPIIAVNSPAICNGATATLTATGGTTYSWNTGQTTNPITVSPTSSTSYTVTGTTNGCSGTSVATVTANPLPTIAVNSPTICTGATATLTATGGTSYSWNTGQTANPITVSPISTTSYTITGTTDGCSGTAVATVTVNPLPTIAVNSPTICTGATATLTATGGTSYSWNTGQTTNPITVSPTSTTSYTITGTTNGCSGTAVATVTVNPLPTIAVNSTTICTGATATLTATGGTSYSWNTGETTNPITVSPSTLSSYTVTGTDAQGCSETSVATITVNSLPTIAVNSPIICSGETATLTATAGASYSWSNGQTTNPITINPTTTTSYTVTGTDAFGCSNTAISNIIINPVPSANAGEDQIITIGISTIIGGAPSASLGTEPYTYSWTPTTGLTPISGDVANPSVLVTGNMNYTLTVTDINGCQNIDMVSLSVDNSHSYAVLRKKLDAAYYQLTSSELYFKYLGEYNNGNLDFKIFDDKHVLKSCPQIISKKYGDNRFLIDLNTCTGITPSSSFYILEVMNEKNEKFMLKFKY